MNASDQRMASRRQWLLHTARAAILVTLAGLSWMLIGRSRRQRCQRPQPLCYDCVLWTRCGGKSQYASF